MKQLPHAASFKYQSNGYNQFIMNYTNQSLHLNTAHIKRVSHFSSAYFLLETDAECINTEYLKVITVCI